MCRSRIEISGGCGDKEGVARAVEILLESVKENWRNSEAMERENAFGILGLLLSSKMGITTPNMTRDGSASIKGGIPECQKLSFELLSIILGFVGYRHARRTESIILNPLAYRVLLVDLDIWRKTAHVTQKLYYEQFAVFGVESKYHQFNAKRLLRMRRSSSFVVTQIRC